MRDKTYDNRATTSEELLLIRAGHHLWALRGKQKWQETALMSALETIWEAKRTLRAGLRESYRQSREKSNMHLSKGKRFGKLAPVVDLMEALKASLAERR